MTNREDLSYAEMKYKISPPGEAEAAGLEDGTRNLPAAGDAELAPFQKTLRVRTQEVMNEVSTWLQGEIRKFEELTTSICQRTRPQKESAALGSRHREQLQEAVNMSSSALGRADKKEQGARSSRDNVYQNAGAEPPTGDLETPSSFATGAGILGAFELALTYGVLSGPVEPITAFVSAIVTPVIVFLSGGFSGFMALRPADKSERASGVRIGKLVASVAGGCFAVLFVAIVSSWRTALVAGFDGDWRDTLTVLSNTEMWLSSWETYALAGLALVAFAYAFHSVQAYFHGYVPELRNRHEAWLIAHADRNDLHDTVKGEIQTITQSGNSALDTQCRTEVQACNAVGPAAQSLKGSIFFANKSIEKALYALDTESSKYIYANQHSRSEGSPAWSGIVLDAAPFDIPAEIDNRVQRADQAKEDWIEATSVQKTILADVEVRALAQVRAMAGLNDVLEDSTNRSARVAWRAA